MNTKRKIAAGRQVLHVEGKPGESKEQATARLNLGPTLQAAQTLRDVVGGPPDNQLDLVALFGELSDQVLAVQDGNLARPEAMLVAQAHTLDVLFNRLARLAMLNVGHYMGATETYMRLALKAQAQARSTIETLNEMKNPRPVAFVAQANVGQNVQVNNGDVPSRSGARGKLEDEQTELLGASDGERLDTGTASTPGRGNQALETVGQIDGAENGRG